MHRITCRFAALFFAAMAWLPTLHGQTTIIRYDTVCPGATGTHCYMDTLFFDGFDDGLGSCWTSQTGTTSTGFRALSTAYLRNTTWRGEFARAMDYPNYSVFDIDLTETTSPTLANMSKLTTPGFEIADPANTTVEFYVIDYATTLDIVQGGYSQRQTFFDEVAFTYSVWDGTDYATIGFSNYGYSFEFPWYINCNGCEQEEQNITTWTRIAPDITFLSDFSLPNPSYFSFMHAAEGGAGFGLDNVLFYGPRCIEIPEEVTNASAGSDLTSTVTVYRKGCTPTNIVTYWHVMEDQVVTEIVADDSYEWGGTTYTESGLYCGAGRTDEHGCTVVDCIDLTINVATIDTVDLFVDSCDRFYWPDNGQTYTASAIDTAVLATAANKDSVVVLHLTIRGYSQDSTLSVTACDSYVSPIDGQTLSSSGDYSATLSTAAGCDSLFTLNLTIYNSSVGPVEPVSACDSYSWEATGETYTSSGTQTATLRNAAGCDSTASIDLTINLSSDVTISVTACDQYYWDATDVTYTQSTSAVTSGFNMANCDSATTLQLTITQSSVPVTLSASACDSYYWDFMDSTFTVSASIDTVITNVAGCDSAISFSVSIAYSTQSSDTVDACLSYLWSANGETYGATGVYSATLTNAAECDSNLTLSLTVNDTALVIVPISACDSFYWEATDLLYSQSVTDSALDRTAEGCDSLNVLQLSIGHSAASRFDTTACDSYFWPVSGVTYSASVAFDTTFSNVEGCDSVVSVAITINQSSEPATIDVAACDAYTWLADGNTYTSNGSHVATLVNAAGCDSVVTLQLTINNAVRVALPQTACDSFMWDATGLTYYASVDDSVVSTMANGCDSATVLQLVVNYSDEDETLSEMACDSYAWEEYDTIFTSSTTYTAVNINSVGCTNLVSITVDIHHDTTVRFNESACGSYYWPMTDETYTESGEHSVTLTDVAGCDSVITLNLTFGDALYDTVRVEECDSVLYDGALYYESDQYTVVGTTTEGCDSITTVVITVGHSSPVTTQTVTADNRYTWDVTGQHYVESGTYPVSLRNADGCDSTIVLDLTINIVEEPLPVMVRYDTLCPGESGCRQFMDTLFFDDFEGDDFSCWTSLPGSGMTDDDACYGFAASSQMCATYEPTYCVPAYRGGHSLFEAANGMRNINVLNENPAYSMALYYTSQYATPYLDIVDPGRTTITYDFMDESILYDYLMFDAQGNITFDESTAYSEAYNIEIFDELGLLYRQDGTNYLLWDINCGEGCSDDVNVSEWTRNYVTMNDATAGSMQFKIAHASRGGVGAGIDNLLIYGPRCVYIPAEATASAGGANYVSRDTVYRIGCTPTVIETHWHVRNVAVAANDTVVDSSYYSYTWHGSTYTSSGLYSWNNNGNLTNAYGCDSTAYLRLVILTADTTYTDVDTCADTYTWHGNTYSIGGSYMLKLAGTHGDTTLAFLNLVLRHNKYYDTLNVVTCDSYTWPMNGRTYTASTNRAEHTVASDGCDSIVTLILTIRYNTRDTVYDTICQGSSYSFGGQDLRIGGHFVSSRPMAEDCDSIRDLFLYVKPLPDLAIKWSSQCEDLQYTLVAYNPYADTLMAPVHWEAFPGDGEVSEQALRDTIYVHPTMSTMYSVSMQYEGAYACPVKKSVTLAPPQSVKAEIKVSTPIFSSEVLDVRAMSVGTGQTAQKWFVDDEYYSPQAIIDYHFTPNDEADSVRLMLRVNNEFCADSDSVTIRYILGGEIFVPSVFAPSEDLINTFMARGHNIIEFEIYIYNRQGLLTFQSTSIDEGWDGTLKDGTPAPQGAYVYTILYRNAIAPKEKKRKTGTVLLVR